MAVLKLRAALDEQPTATVDENPAAAAPVADAPEAAQGSQEEPKRERVRLEYGELVEGTVVRVERRRAFIRPDKAPNTRCVLRQNDLTRDAAFTSNKEASLMDVLQKGEAIRCLVRGRAPLLVGPRDERRQIYHVILSTKALEAEPGDMLRDRRAVYEGAPARAVAHQALADAPAAGDAEGEAKARAVWAVMHPHQGAVYQGPPTLRSMLRWIGMKIKGAALPSRASPQTWAEAADLLLAVAVEARAKRESDFAKTREACPSLQVGQELDGKVSNVKSFGVFVEVLDGAATGVVHRNQVPDLAPGTSMRTLYRMGQALRVRVAALDSAAGRLELVLAGPVEQPAATA